MSNRLAYLRRLTASGAVAAALLAPAALVATTAGPALAQEQVQKGGTLNVIVQPEPPILVLGLNQQGPTQTVAGKIYEGLLRYDHDLNPMPGLAESWEVSPDGLTYTFKLRPNAKWHDGTPFTAKDVVFTTAKFLPEVHPRARANFSHVESVTAPDDHTVTFKLKQPFPAFMKAFEVSSAPMMPAHIYDGTDYKQNPKNSTPIGTGPFKFQQWVKGSHIHLVRNGDYYLDGKPYLDGIYFRVIPDAASRALALESGQVDISQYNDVEPFDVPRLKELPHLTMTTKGYEFVAPLSWIEINTRSAPLEDKRFRQALAHGLNREFIRDRIWFGLGRVATGPVNSVTPFHEPDVPEYEYDTDKAEELLDEMGLEPNGSGVRAEITLTPMPYGETWARLGEYIKQSWGKIGVKVNLESTDVAGWVQKVSNWDYQTTNNFVYQYGDPSLGVARTYISDNIRKGVMFSNTMGYSNPKVDELFAKAAVENDAGQRGAQLSEAQKILVGDMPVIWLLEMEFPTFVNKRVHNAVTTAIGTSENFADTWVEKK
ncbi:ABC transporter substrate-binding protein [Skermanella sp. TT6]|uniref:ABC transporter substrate-binding protein n=1 Tax=Skermanella cutis TaxID=2775420 RepID=A0ABX7B340_9PROT|nr:ABC transporter substrate-binding protein [Skermanella sp. TT6]QQP87585.1 ABC transporter substrate-binding protein [Skermanella sp. TT6]